MTDQFIDANKMVPITPPPELVRQWMERTEYDEHTWFYESYIAEQAANWGADQELEACCEWMKSRGYYFQSDELRTDRRPKPPSLKKQALAVIENSAICDHLVLPCMTQEHEAILRRAIESLPS